MPTEPLRPATRLRAKDAAERAANRQYLALVASEARRLARQIRASRSSRDGRRPMVAPRLRTEATR